MSSTTWLLIIGGAFAVLFWPHCTTETPPAVVSATGQPMPPAAPQKVCTNLFDELLSAQIAKSGFSIP